MIEARFTNHGFETHLFQLIVDVLIPCSGSLLQAIKSFLKLVNITSPLYWNTIRWPYIFSLVQICIREKQSLHPSNES